MPDITSSLLQLLLQETGGNENNWGELLNGDLSKIETAIAGKTSLVSVGGITTLTDDQCRPPVIRVTGILASNCTLVVPARLKTWTVQNGTTGAYTVTIKTASGAGVAVPPGGAAFVHCDGTDVVALALPTGPLSIGADRNVTLDGVGSLFTNPTGAGNAFSRIVPGASAATGYWDNWNQAGVRVGYGHFWDGGLHTGYWGLNAADVVFGANNSARLRLKSAGGAEIYGATSIGGDLSLVNGGLYFNDGYGLHWGDSYLAATDSGPINFAINGVVGANLGATGFVVGSPTGGYTGFGSLNAQALYVGGVAVLTAETTKAAVAFTGSSGAILSSQGNVGSVSRVSTGFYTINFTTPFADANFTVQITCYYAADNAAGVAGLVGEVARISGAKTVSAVTIRTGFYNGTLVDPLEVYVTITR